MTISFFPNKEKQNKKTLAIPVFLRVIGFRQKAEARISIEISPEEHENWNSRLFRFNEGGENANRLINKYQQKFDEYILLNADKLGEISAKEIRDYIMGLSNKKVPLVIEYVKRYFEKNIKTRQTITSGTVKNYSKAINHLESFLKHTNRLDINLIRFDKIVAYDFCTYLLSEIPEIKKTKLTEPSAAGYIKKVKAIIQVAEFQGLIQNNPFNGIKLKVKSPKREKLNSFEIRNIYECDFSDYPHLDRIRDYFLLSAFTGLAYTDLKDLNLENLQVWKTGDVLLELKRQKTDVETRQFLVSYAVKLIEKYTSISTEQKRILPLLTNQTLNLGLKLIAEKTNIKKNLSTHIARHSFRQLIAESGLRDIATIKMLMGHSRSNDIDSVYHTVTEKQLLEAKEIIQKHLDELLIR